jgi:hypothetical protein
MFPKSEVERIAILDLRTLNMDRNTGNILVQRTKQLVPIDHGLTFPDTLCLSEHDVCWMGWSQIKDEMSETALHYIESIDIDADASVLSM